jgi:hypothetical protein
LECIGVAFVFLIKNMVWSNHPDMHATTRVNQYMWPGHMWGGDCVTLKFVARGAVSAADERKQIPSPTQIRT